MQPLDEYPIDKGTISGPPVSSPRKTPGRWWSIAAICLVAALIAALFFLRRPERDPGTSATEVAIPTAEQTQQPPRSLGPLVEPRDLPPLNLTDPLVRE